MGKKTNYDGLNDALKFSSADALYGRGTCRFFYDAGIPDGYFIYKSRHDYLPLTDIEKIVVLTAGGNTGWHNLIMRAARYASYLFNYVGSAGGRTFHSAAGFYTSELFFSRG